jgi:hypothetical protein
MYIKELERVGGTLPAAAKNAMTALFKEDVFDSAGDAKTVDLILKAFKASLKEVVSDVTPEEAPFVEKLLEAVVKDFEVLAEEKKAEFKTDETLKLIEDVVNEVEPLEGLTSEETIKVYNQVALEFKNKTRIAEVLAFNAGVAE